MTRPALTKTNSHGGRDCRHCGATMRLFGVESHPTIDEKILRTYVCEHCDGVQTELAPRRNRTGSHKKRVPKPTIALLANKVFDDETTSRLGEAYEAAWQTLKASGSPLADRSRAGATRERLARCIIELGQRGETDPDRLSEKALARLAGSAGGSLPAAPTAAS
jgi:hypothetical protein